MGASHFGKDTSFLTKFLPPQPPLSKGGARIQPAFLPNRDAPNNILVQQVKKHDSSTSGMEASPHS